MEKILNFFERVIAFVLLILLLPLFAIVSVLIILDLKSSPIFKQQRMGLNSNPFCIYKFRTLKPHSPDNIPTDSIQSYSEYSTKFGLLLRATSIDEIPQLLNIIKGEMSFVGPRPVMLNEVELNSRRTELGIYSIRPGITGWSQVNGRDSLEIDKKIYYDLEYLNRKSVLFDMYILFLTMKKVIKREDIKRG